MTISQLSNVRLLSILNSTVEGIWTIGMDGLINFVNDAAVKLFGYDSAEDMLGRNSHELVHHTRANGIPYPRVECPIYHAFQNGTSVHLEDEVLWRADDSSFLADYRTTPIWENGTIVGTVTTFSDNTERHTLSVNLSKSEEWLATTLSSIGDAVIATQADEVGSIVFMNPIAERLTGWTFAEAKGKPVLDVFHIVHQKTREPAINPVRRVIEEGIIVGLANHTSLIAKDGREYIIEDSAAPVKNAAGELTGVVLVFRDSTEEHRLRDDAGMLARVVEFAPCFIGVADSKGRAKFVNEYGRKMMGISSVDEVVSSNVLDYFTSAEKVRVAEDIIPKVMSHGHWDGEVNFQNFQTKEVIPVLWNAFTVMDEETSEMKAMACVSTDLRDYKKLEEEKESTAARVEIERSRLFNLFSQSPIPICMLEGPEHLFTLANQSYSSLFFKDRALLGKTVKEAIPEIENQGFIELLDGVYNSGVTYHGVELPIEIEQVNGTHRLFFLNFVYQPMLNERGEVIGILVAATDVTPQVDARKFILESEKRFKALADSMPQLVWAADPSGEVEYVNQGMVDYAGLASGEIFSWQSRDDFIHLDDLQSTIVKWKDAFSRGIPYEAEFRIRRFDGTYRWFLSRGVPVRDENGVISTWYGSCTDIEDHKKLSQELMFAKNNAENATRVKSAFLANMSHEIRTPLGAILGFSEFLLDPHQTISDRHDCVMTIRRNSEQLSRLINELLDLSKIEADRLEVEKVTFKLEDVVQDVFQLLSIHAKEKGILLNFASSGPLPKTVSSDPTRLRQILINIVGNAIKFTSRGHVDMKIGLISPRAEGLPLFLTFTVSDTGIGLSSDQVLKIWEPFVQADTSTTRRFGGTGLGLSLSRNLSRALGGDLLLTHSELGKGSTFTITIEAGLPETTPLFDQEPSLVSPISAPSGHLPFAHIYILVVDDSTDNQALVRRFLLKEGATVDTASDGEQGVAKALAGHYDLVLMDVQMPLLDGYEATAVLLEKGYKTPIIALTAHAMKGEKERAIEHGFYDYLTKPLDRKALLEKVSAIARAKIGHLASDVAVTSPHYLDPAFEDPEVQMIIKEFRVNIFPAELRILRLALRRGDWQEIARVGHALKGSVGAYVMPNLSELGGNLEFEAMNGGSRETIEGLIAKLENLDREAR